MAMVCPQCGASYEQRLQCAQCNGRLVYQDAVRGTPALIDNPTWQQTPWGRIIIGLLLAQGIYYGLRRFLVAGLMATDAANPDDFSGDMTGVLILQGLQLVAVFVGGLLAGAGQIRGALYGLLLGVWNGIFLVAAQAAQSIPYNTVTVYGQPVIQAACGALAGWIGSRIWRAITPTGHPGVLLNSNVPPPPQPSRPLFAGPIFWVRVVIGTCVAVGGTLWADVILDFVLRASGNKPSAASTMHAHLVTWEITALAMLAGSVFAGATTRNGMKQGLAVGVASMVILFGIRVANPVPPSFEVLAMCTVAPLILGVAGGGFGAQLLPPLRNVRRRPA